ncbi:MAG TPA: tape measure protein [Longimicrobiaceae bacterium]
MTVAQSAVRDLGKQMTKAGKAMTAGITVPLGALAALTVRSATQMDSLRRALDAVTGSADETNRQLERLRDLAKAPGLGFREAIEGSVRLQAVGFSAQFAERVLREFANAIALTGGGAEDLRSVQFQLTQLAAKGRVLSEDLKPILSSAPVLGKVLNEAFGTVDPEQIQKLGLTTEEFLNILLEHLERLDRVSGGARTSFENLADAWFRASAVIGDKLLPAVIPLVDGITELLGKVREINPDTVRFAIAIAAMAAVMGPAAIALGSLATAAAAFSTALGVGLLPLIVTGGAVVAALGILGAKFLDNKLAALEAAGAVEQYKQSLVGLTEEELRRRKLALAFQADALRSQIADTQPFRTIQGSAATLGQSVQIVNKQFVDLNAELDRVLRQSMQIDEALAQFGDKTKNTLSAAADEAARLRVELSRLSRLGDVTPSVAITEGGPSAVERIIANNERRRRAQEERRREFEGLGGSLETIQLPARAEAAAPEQAGGFLSQISSQVGTQIMGLVAKFGPLAAVAAALKPAFEGLMEVLRPVLDTLAEPLKIIGQLIGSQLAPTLKLLAPPLRLLAKIASYVSEAFGLLVRAVGKAIDALPFVSAKGIINAGQEMIDAARSARRALEDTSEGVEDMGEAVDAFTESVTNQARIVNLNLLRLRASNAGGGGGGGGSGGGGRRPPLDIPGARPPLPVDPEGPGEIPPFMREHDSPHSRRGEVNIGTVNIQAAPGDDGETLWRKFSRTLKEKVASGEVTELQLAVRAR